MDKTNYLEKLIKLQELMLSEMNSKNDNRTKVVGDKVRVWDGSYNIDDNGVDRPDIEPLFEDEAIVIEIGCDKKVEGLDDDIKTLDLRLNFPKYNINLWTASMFVQLIDFEETESCDKQILKLFDEIIGE